MTNMFRPNYRRANAIFSEIEALRYAIEEAKNNPERKPGDVETLLEDLHTLEHEFYLTGVTSEYEL